MFERARCHGGETSCRSSIYLDVCGELTPSNLSKPHSKYLRWRFWRIWLALTWHCCSESSSSLTDVRLFFKCLYHLKKSCFCSWLYHQRLPVALGRFLQKFIFKIETKIDAGSLLLELHHIRWSQAVKNKSLGFFFPKISFNLYIRLHSPCLQHATFVVVVIYIIFQFSLPFILFLCRCVTKPSFHSLSFKVTRLFIFSLKKKFIYFNKWNYWDQSLILWYWIPSQWPC